ncbi:MAG: lamin tail domain-containing protein [Caldilineaceae bacterium]
MATSQRPSIRRRTRRRPRRPARRRSTGAGRCRRSTSAKCWPTRTWSRTATASGSRSTAPGAAPVNLRGWILADLGTDEHVIAADVVVAPGAYVVLGRNADRATNGGVTLAYVYSGVSLANTDDEVLLLAPNGEEADRVVWGDNLREHGCVAGTGDVDACDVADGGDIVARFGR